MGNGPERGARHETESTSMEEEIKGEGKNNRGTAYIWHIKFG